MVANAAAYAAAYTANMDIMVKHKIINLCHAFVIKPKKKGINMENTIGNLGNYGGLTAQNKELSARKETQVEQEMNLLSKNVEETKELVMALYNRLIPIMRKPNEGENIETPIQELTPLAQEIRNNRFGVENVKGTIQDILDRLEL